MDQPWGGLNINVEGSNYFQNFDQHRLELNGDIELRLLKGLFLEIGGGVEFIHDQLHLPREGASLEDILLRRRELTTSYEYEMYIGISYTFGSIYNNIVNDRL